MDGASPGASPRITFRRPTSHLANPSSCLQADMYRAADARQERTPGVRWLALEPELVAAIARKLDTASLAALRLTCSAWRRGASLGVEKLAPVRAPPCLCWPLCTRVAVLRYQRALFGCSTASWSRSRWSDCPAPSRASPRSTSAATPGSRMPSC